MVNVKLLREMRKRRKNLEAKLKKSNSGGKIKRLSWYLPANYVFAVLPHKPQKWFAKMIGSTPKKETTFNATVFGIGGMSLECILALYLGDEVQKLIPGTIAEILGTTYKTAVYTYWASFGVVQSSIRLAYTQKTGKGAFAVGIVPAIINAPYLIGKGVVMAKNYLGKKKNK